MKAEMEPARGGCDVGLLGYSRVAGYLPWFEAPAQAGLDADSVTQPGTGTVRTCPALPTQSTEDHDTIESQARLGTIPINEFVDGLPITPLRVRAGQTV
ncbi:MAG TPA: hypothetical protein VMU26_13625 [Candidatus Polarisedimenticolia bacterium]|nr:hypothetical protein [Candidatus Polarisedimenticolia bacterium]